MKRLSELLDNVRVLEIENSTNPEISGLEYDSRRVGKGSCFFAVVGGANDGHNYIDSAIEQGATAIICQHMPQNRKEGVAYIVVEDSNIAMAAMAAAFYSHPSEELRLVGVTGTNGKTTIATLHATLDAGMSGEYKVYLNLPDPYPTIHDNPLFSIRLANENVWEEATGYNKIAEFTL